MKKINDRNILLNRLLLSLGILTFIRIGTFLPIPSINHQHLAFYLERHSLTKTFINTFSGNKIFVIGLFTLNIFPYINASILIQTLISFFPNLYKLQKEGGNEGKRSITKLTRLLTLGWAFIQSFSITIYLKKVLFNWDIYLAVEIIVWLTTGAMIVLWLSEIITEYGLGNGPSLLIYTNIVSNLPNVAKNLFITNHSNISIQIWITGIIVFLIAIYGIVLLQEGTRIIHLVSSKQLNQTAQYISKLFEVENENNYIPLRFNQAGVMPIILTTAILIIPNYITSIGLLPIISVPIFGKSSKIIYWISYFILISLFSSFYSTLILNPKDVSNELQKMAVSIPEIRPGIETTFYLRQIMKRVTYLGAIILAILTTLPNLIQIIIPNSNFNSLGTTSLLILVGVILDLSREIRSIILSNIYNEMFT